jgi:hypothetical protein
MRALFAAVVAFHIPLHPGVERISAPNGLARLLDLTFLLNPTAFDVCRYAAYAALVLYVLRVGWWLTLPYLTLFCVAFGSVLNSRGAIGHHLQIVALVLLAQTVALVIGPMRRNRGASAGSTTTDEDRLINWSQQAIAATYLVSGVTKLLESSGAWILQSPLVALQVMKTNEQDFYDALGNGGAGAALATAEWMASHPLLVGIAMTGGLLLELGAPAMLLGRGWAACYGLALIVFHESIGAVMKLNFVYNKYLIWIYLVNVPFWILLAWRSARRRSSA